MMERVREGEGVGGGGLGGLGDMSSDVKRHICHCP